MCKVSPVEYLQILLKRESDFRAEARKRRDYTGYALRRPDRIAKFIIENSTEGGILGDLCEDLLRDESYQIGMDLYDLMELLDYRSSQHPHIADAVQEFKEEFEYREDKFLSKQYKTKF